LNSKELDFLISALTEHNPFMKTESFMDWFFSRQQAHKFQIDQIPFEKLKDWSFEPSTGNLVHASGKFFTIEGIWVEANVGRVSQWSQPIINQPEIGILGILAKNFDGILYFLMQAKMEPGNIHLVQLAPTLQATRSNYTHVHRGGTPPYLEYFLDKSDSTVLVDSLQSEQGARFLRKRNRNIIIETSKEVPVLDDYCWLTLGQIHKLIQYDNIINMDARTVLSCIQFAAPELKNRGVSGLLPAVKELGTVDVSAINCDFDEFQLKLFTSAIATNEGVYDSDTIISWFTELKVLYELNTERIPLKFVKNWHKTDYQIVHDEEKYFAVIAVAVQADNREVPSWTQPLMKPQEDGIVAYLARNINGILHFLVQAKVEAGNFDVVEMAPTVQCVTGNYKDEKPENLPPFLEYVSNVPPEQVHFSTFQSEEGGRFFQEENRNMLIQLGDDFPLKVPDNYIWMTMGQIKNFIKYNNFFNVEGRCLLSCFSFL